MQWKRLIQVSLFLFSVFMKIFERYFERNELYGCPDFRNSPEIIVTIPVFNDRDIFATVRSLRKCTCRNGNAGVIIVVNHGENAAESVKMANRMLLEELRQSVVREQNECSALCFEVVEAFDLPAKKAGVGLARKIAMDAAACFFYRHGKPGCPILSLDADTWVDENYLDETGRYFREHPVAGVSISYAHRLEECDGETADAMVKYELYLRY
ncbi:MAG: glycosyltransferase family 2 protein, partial [Odoribacter sp.]|nr:glycosyltransferase family 2 protein [Odoribacter sp.]